MAAVDLTGEVQPGRVTRTERGRSLPVALSRCRRVVAVTVHLPEFVLAAAGLVQRLDAAGVPIDVLEVAALDDDADEAAATALACLGVSLLRRHRLALPAPIVAERSDDVVAAMSELVGFDPEPGVFCLTPATGGDGAQPPHAVVGGATERIAEVYRIRLVRFTVTSDDPAVQVELTGDEWRRKCEALAACATDVTPLSGRREYFGL